MHEWLKPDPLVLAGALTIDLLLGEMPGAIHPVVWMGRVISILERLAPTAGRARQLLYGGAIALLLPTACAALGGLLLFATRDHPALHAIGAVFLLKATFALRALGAAARAVQAPLSDGRLEEARRNLLGLCSRDAGRLNEDGIAGAAIESVAENASDSWVAPLFYYCLLGLPGAMAYRAANTLDARIGYRGKYESLGKSAARIDDLLNLIPSRITAVFLILSGRLCGQHTRNGWRIWRRDHRRTESPNAGHPMAAMAGLLDVRLSKADHYSLGDSNRLPSPNDIGAAWKIVFVSGLLAGGATLLLLGGLHA